MRNMEAKQIIRKKNLAIRRNMDKMLVEKNSRLICERLIRLNIINNASAVFVYAPINNEVDLGYLINWARNKGIQIGFPKVEGTDMLFYRIDNEAILKRGYFNIMEPTGEEKLLELDDDVVVIVPGVAFDKEGYRVGYGKGFYDRYLSTNIKATKIGVGYNFQIVDAIDRDEFDIAMDIVVDEKGEVLINDRFTTVM